MSSRAVFAVGTFLVLAVSLAAAPPNDKEKRIAAELEKLQGVWKLERIEFADGPLNFDSSHTYKVVEGQKVHFVDDLDGNFVWTPSAVRLPCPIATPKQMLWMPIDDDGKGTLQNGKRTPHEQIKDKEFIHAIYAIDGDTLKIAYQDGGRTFPKDFKAVALPRQDGDNGGISVRVEVYSRTKKKPADFLPKFLPK